MSHGALKAKVEGSLLTDRDELALEALDGISGGAVTVSRPKEASDEANIDSAIGAAPEFEHTGSVQAGGATQVTSYSATASGSASVGHTDEGKLGDVVVTSKYTIGAQATATAGPTGVSAGVTVGGGVSTTIDAGKGVQVEIATAATGKAGVDIGIENNGLKGSAGAKIGIESTVEQRYESGTFGDGAKVKQSAYASAEISAEAGVDGKLGLDGTKFKTLNSAGAAYRAGASVEVGNEEASGKVEGGVISPGAFSQGFSGGAGFSDGKLSLEFGGEIAVGIAGVSFNIGFDVQLLDNTHTVGSEEEIKAVEDGLKSIPSVAQAELNRAWLNVLSTASDKADGAVKEAENRLSNAQNVVDNYNKQVEARADDFENKLKDILERKEALQSREASADTAQQLKRVTETENQLRAEIAKWEASMETPEQVKRRESLRTELIIQEKRADLFQDVANALAAREKSAQPTVEPGVNAQIELSKANDAWLKSKAEHDIQKEHLDNETKMLDEKKDSINKELENIARDREEFARKMQAHPNENFQKNIAHLDALEAKLEARLPELAKEQAVIDQRIEAVEEKQDAAEDKYDALREKYGLATGFVAKAAKAEFEMIKADHSLHTVKAEYDIIKERVDSRIKELDNDKLNISKEMQMVERERAEIARKMQQYPNENFQGRIAHLDAVEAKIEARLPEIEKERTVVTERLDAVTDAFAVAQEQHDAVKQKMTQIHPIWSIEADIAEAQEMAQQIREKMQSSRNATPLELGLMQVSLEAAMLMETSLKGQADHLRSIQKSFDSMTENLQAEYTRLTEVVTDKGAITRAADAIVSVADDIGDWF